MNDIIFSGLKPVVPKANLNYSKFYRNIWITFGFFDTVFIRKLLKHHQYARPFLIYLYISAEFYWYFRNGTFSMSCHDTHRNDWTKSECRQIVWIKRPLTNVISCIRLTLHFHKAYSTPKSEIQKFQLIIHML